ncbi:isopenicillin N synthase-like protein [Metarhizium robertsii]|uniref:Isopenicillin N synthase-like protein n=1 Tax=Metarhizium robertsii TaxID=568076 RepID=A0A014P9S6_9HYPO|nr:isopenicillin N synthase-like protein [Metarhizium robertsii]
MTEQVPIIDLTAYYNDGLPAQEAIRAIHDAASTWGFFLITKTRVSPQVQSSLVSMSRTFFDLPLESKMALDVHSGGVAWRGYMPLGGEHTHGRLDWKEGLYVGPEHADDHPLAGLPLHGRNQFPDFDLPEMRPTVLKYVDQVTELGKTLTDMFSLALGLGRAELRQTLLEPEPVVLFRCFKYQAVEGQLFQDKIQSFGIGEHTDFGFLTILKVDSPGLQILSPSDKWVDVPVLEDCFIVNIGDMFDQLTHGRYRSRPHRVCRPGPGNAPRFSFPLFFDFAWNAKMVRLPLHHLTPLSEEEIVSAKQRWAGTTFRSVQGLWSQYLARKMQKVFPDLNMEDFEPNAAPSTRFTRVVGT